MNLEKHMIKREKPNTQLKVWLVIEHFQTLHLILSDADKLLADNYR